MASQASLLLQKQLKGNWNSLYHSCVVCSDWVKFVGFVPNLIFNHQILWFPCRSLQKSRRWVFGRSCRWEQYLWMERHDYWTSRYSLVSSLWILPIWKLCSFVIYISFFFLFDDEIVVLNLWYLDQRLVLCT